MERINNIDMTNLKWELQPLFENEAVRYDPQGKAESEYTAFIDKFKTKKTTDECYTPPAVYEAVKMWLGEQINIEGRTIVRPFYPGGNYQGEQYPEGCIVLDNPPFSILGEICRWYLFRGIDFFLFAPTLTLFPSSDMRLTSVVCDASIVYENGAVVNTSFRTSLFPDVAVWVDSELRTRILDAQIETSPSSSLPKYVYPSSVITAARLGKLVKHGISLKVRHNEAVSVSTLDAQRPYKKAIFGNGYLISREATERVEEATERVEEAIEREEEANRIVWELSPRELSIIRDLDKNRDFIQQDN